MNSPASMEEALGRGLSRDFLDFASDSADGLIETLSNALNVPIALLDGEGKVLAGSAPGVEAGETAPPAPEGAPAVPIGFEEVALGALVAYAADERLEPLIRSLAGELENHFGLERETITLTDRLSHSYDVTNLLQSYVRNLRPNKSLGWNARRLLAETAELLDHRLLIQWLPEHECLGWNAGPGLELSDRMRWLTANQLALDNLLDELTMVPDVNNTDVAVRHRGSVATPDGALDYLIMPVRGPSAVLGFAGLVKNEEDHSFETTEIRVLECLVEELTNTATNRELQFEIRSLLFNVMKSLVAALEAKDDYTRGHSERVYGLSVQIAERLGLPDKEIKILAWAALLHDMGKIGVDERILKKPGKLTDEEYEAIKTHPAKGAAMLDPIMQLRAVIPGIRHHHERWDGRGYPDGLAGEDVPLLGRIIAVADTYDAIVSSRPYRPARTAEQALAVIREGAGSQFDPEIAEVFLKMAEEGEVASAETRRAETIPV